MRLLSTLVTFCFIFMSSVAFSQRYAVASGNWTDPIWATTRNGVAGSAVTPTATDDVYTNTRNISVTSNVTCRNLFVSYNTANSVTLGALRVVSITGTLSGYDDLNQTEEFPTASVFSFGNGSRLTFTGANVQPLYTPYVIYFWDQSIPLGRAYFDFGVGVTRRLIISIDIGVLARVVSGTLAMDPGAVLSGSGAALEINSGATFTTNNALGTFNSVQVGGTLTSTSTINATSMTVLGGGVVTASNTMSIGSLTVDALGSIASSGVISTTNSTLAGTITTSNAFNTSTNFTMNSTGILNTSYVGGAGWFTSTYPNTINLDPLSTINFSANGAQSIPIATYGNLTLSGSGNKTASGTGSLTFTGNVNNTSSSVTFSPTQDVLFTGSAAVQTISGTGSISFASGLEIDKVSGSVNVNRAISVSGGLTLSSGTLNLTSQTLTLQSGNITNTGGTFTPGTGTVIINSATQLNGTVSFNNLTLGASGSLLAPASSLTISGNLTNNGSANAFNANSGTLAFNGTGNQTLTGPFTLNNITCTNSGTDGVLIAGTVNLVGTLTLTSGLFDADGLANTGVFTVRSTGLGSGGRIAALAPANFSGQVTVERFVDAPEDYRYFSVPVIGATLASWQDDIAITGNFSNPTTPAQNANVANQTAPSVFTFNGATQSFVAVGTGAATSTHNLSNTRAYVAWTYVSGNTVIDMTGTIGKGNINITGLTANQYNLVPNPYPSAIDWDLVTRTGFSNSMYMTTGQGTFATYTAGGGFGINHPNNNWSGQVALGQSFYVQSTGGTSLPFTESAKVSTYDFVRENEPVDYFKVKLQGPNSSDELGIAFREGATLEFDEEFDALKKSNPAGLINFSSYIASANNDLAINILPKIQCNQTIKLKTSQLVNGEHTISFSALDKMVLGYAIKLKDNKTGIEKTIDPSVTHSFTVNTNDPTTFADGRFELRLGSPQVDPAFAFGLTSEYECSSEYVKVNFTNSQLGVKYLFKLNDVNLHEPIQAAGANDVVLIPKSQLQYGSNQLTLVASSVDGCNAHIYNQAVSVNYHELPAITSITSATSCKPGSMTLTASGAPANGSYRWYESENSVDPLENQSSSSLITPELSVSKTYYVTALNSNGCESLVRTAVNASVGSPSEISSVVNGSVCGKGVITLQASGAPANGSYRWYEAQTGGNAIADATSARFTTPSLEQSKTYYVSAVTPLGCESAIRMPVTATVNSLTSPVITVNGFELSVTAGDNTIQWFKDGVSIEGATTNTFSVRETGTYSVKLNNAGGCSTTSEGMDFIVLGVEDNTRKNGFIVYPNPTEGLLTIDGNEIGMAKISMWDTNGKAIDNAIVKKSPNSFTTDITKYPKGLYIINVLKKNTLVQFKVVKK